MRKSISFLFVLSVFMYLSSDVFAQISFTNKVSELSDPTHYSGVAVAINDVNKDGLDDIVILDGGQHLKIEYQNLDGVWTSLDPGVQMDNSSAWGMAVGDANNNGFGDVFSNKFGTAPNYSLPDYAQSNSDGTVYTRTELPVYGLATQCVNLADIDADGDLDFYSCGDTGPGGIWENDGTGGFSYSGDDLIRMTPTDNPGWGSWDGSGNYGSTFTDIDLDGDLDFYITHCRQGVGNSSDPRRINQLFINDGNGNYTEDFTNANQLRIGSQSWTTDFQDFDNDGDFDAFMTNHDVDNMLLENVNGVFVDIFSTSGLDMTVGTPIQGLMRDFDNDMFVDIIVTGSDNTTTYALYKNNGDKTYTRIDGAFGPSGLYSLATGDLNHDGFLDVYGSYATIYTNPSQNPDAVWINDGNDNNWLAVVLEGTISNKSAIGSVVRMYGPWGMQVREVRSGESYGICNSLTSYFGLAQNTQIDSVVIDWPSSGIHQVIENPAPNQFLTVIENECVAPQAFVTSSGPTVLCAGESLDLMATAGTNYTYEWSTGEQTQQISVTTAGMYMVRITDTDAGSACSSVSAAIEVAVSPDQTPEIVVAGDLKFCEGESVTLTSSSAAAYQWSHNLGTNQSAVVTESGSYTVTITGACQGFTSEPVQVEVLDAAPPTANGVTLPSAGSANLTATGVGTDFSWYNQPTGGTALATGANYTTPVLNTTTSFWVEELHTYDADAAFGGKTDNTSSDGAYYDGLSFYLQFDVFEIMTIKSVKVYADGAGDRTVYVQDNAGTTVLSQSFTIPDGESRIDFTNWTLPPGADYRFRVLEQNHGLWRDNSQSEVNFPYNLGDLGSITGANTSSSNYYYFYYDWEVEGVGYTCVSNRTEVVVAVETVGIEEDWLSGVEVYPNPASQAVTVTIPSTIKGAVEMNVLGAVGNLVLTQAANTGNNKLDVSNLPSGIYFLQLKTDAGEHLSKLVIR